jgi:hypothetical protein
MSTTPCPCLYVRVSISVSMSPCTCLHAHVPMSMSPCPCLYVTMSIFPCLYVYISPCFLVHVFMFPEFRKRKIVYWKAATCICLLHKENGKGKLLFLCCKWKRKTIVFFLGWQTINSNGRLLFQKHARLQYENQQ